MSEWDEVEWMGYVDYCPAQEQGTPLECDFIRGHDGPHSFDTHIRPRRD